MKRISKGPVRHIRLRAVVAYPAVALVAALTLTMSPFGPGQGFALAALPTPTDTSTAAAAPTTTAPTTTAPPTADVTTAAPTSAPTTDPTTVPTTGATTLTSTSVATTAPDPIPNPTPGADPSLAPILGAAPVDHHVLARIGGTDFKATYLATDTPLLDASQFQTFRVRFQLHNGGASSISPSPRLEYRPDGATGFVVVPQNSKLGSPFRVAREWVPSAGGGTKEGPLGADITVANFTLPVQAGQAVAGHHSMGTNPDAPIILPAGSYTEQEFTVQLSMDAKYLTGYELRITDGGTALTGAQVARIVLGAKPLPQLSAGQRQGIIVIDPKAANPAGAVYPLMNAPTSAAITTSAASAPANRPAGAPRYALASGSLAPATGTVYVISPATDPATDSHDIGSAQCGACHRGHTAQAPDLTKSSEQSTLCFSCHDGTGLGKNVKSQYALNSATGLVNTPASREYYSHDAVGPTSSAGHSLDVNEFAGVSNRHSVCADCHNSHKAGTTNSTQSADGTGWDASGRLAGVSGVKVTNSLTAGVAPTYTLLDGVAGPVTREYQLCFKCHSGSTILTDNAGLKPSQYALDKGVELNPANPSFHPVEAKGTNQTVAMTNSLTGSSPYKLWNFSSTSTVRCLNCHASSTTPGPSPAAPLTPPAPAEGALPPHTSSNRGILLRNYLDRELKPLADNATVKAAYSAGDFALCYVCHGEEPFKVTDSTATNFSLHSKHLTGLNWRGTGGTDIDKPGDGQGKAICAECHFRIHSTTNKEDPAATNNTRLVTFAPNVKPFGTALAWTPGATTGGSCTLTCHGYEHDGETYSR